jgi:hypothetical protein
MGLSVMSMKGGLLLKIKCQCFVNIQESPESCQILDRVGGHVHVGFPPCPSPC